VPADTTNPRSRWIALYVLCVGVLMIVLDATIVNVALPSIQQDLDFSQSSLAWVVNAYLIAFGGLLLLAGRLGDLISRRGVFLVGLVVFCAASLACGLAQSQGMLVGARFVQGIGGAMASAVVLGMIVPMFPEPREQAKAIGVYAFVASAGASAGLLAGGVLTQAINWHWIFFVNIPIGIATAVFAIRLLVNDRGIGFGEGADVLGAILITASLMLLVYTIVKPAADDGWGATRTLELGGIALALLAAFIAREATARNPLIPLRIFRSRNVSGANVIQALLVAGMYGMFFLGALYLERILHYSPLEIGLAFLPSTIVMGTLSVRYTERLIMRFGAKTLMIPGLLMILAGLLLFARTPVDANYFIDVMPAVIVIGAGVGTCFPALMTIGMSGATPEDAGLASGLVNTTLQVGGALGLAVLATLAATRTENLRDAGDSAATALNGGFHLAYLIGAGLVFAAILVAVFVVQGDKVQLPGQAEEPENRDELCKGEPAYSEAG
jgi:EmrB/QacA subfamily drug resistance transporter